MRDPGVAARVAAVTVAAGLLAAACMSRPSQSSSPRPRRSTVPAAAHPLPTTLHQQTGPHFVHGRNSANPNGITVLTSSRDLRPGQYGVVLTVRGLGNLLGSCSPEHPAARFRLTYRGPGPPVITAVRMPLAKPAGLNLLSPYWPPAPSPAGGKQRLAFFQIVGGGESADFSLVLWATLTPVTGGCAFTTNGVLRVRGSDFLQRLG